MGLREQFKVEASRQGIAAFSDRFEAWAVQAGVPTSLLRAFQVVFDELLTNTLDYGLESHRDPRLEVVLQADETSLHAELIDNGQAFDPLQEAALPDLDLELDDRPIGGLGVHLVKQLMDQLHYQRIGDENHVFLRKFLNPSAQGDNGNAQGQ